MVKDCPIHGHFEDVMAIDTEFFKHLEEVFPGRDIRAHNDEKLHNHGSLDGAARPRLGAHGRSHEPLQHDVRPVLHGREPGRLRPRAHAGKTSSRCSTTPSRSSRAGRCRCSSRAASRRCRRTSSTRSAMRARSATTACRPRPTASSSPRVPEFAKAAAEAGLRYAYLQFDGIGNAANSHRRVGNLFDVKLRAIENLHSAGVDIVPVVTIVNGVNNEQVGRDRRVRARQSEEDHLPLVPAGVVHRPRRGGHPGAPRRAALHAVAPGARREESDRHRRADPRLVPDFVHVHVRRLGRRGPRAGSRLGAADLRMPPELRRRHGA